MPKPLPRKLDFVCTLLDPPKNRVWYAAAAFGISALIALVASGVVSGDLWAPRALKFSAAVLMSFAVLFFSQTSNKFGTRGKVHIEVVVGLCHLRNGDAATAFVVKMPGERGRRVAAPALRLFSSENYAHVPIQKARRRERSLTCLAVLALAKPEGLDDAAPFARTYGFDYEAEIHRGTFDVLKSRARGQLSEFATLERVERLNRPEVSRASAFVDPRCLPDVRTEILQALTTGPTETKELASRLNIAVRTAQQALHMMVEDGSCISEKDKRHTYKEPTNAR